MLYCSLIVIITNSESHMFNKLEQIATSADPATPVLGCKITRALKPKYVGTQVSRDICNGVDTECQLYSQCMLCSFSI